MILIFVIFLVVVLCGLRWQRRRKIQCMKQFKNDFLSIPFVGHAPLLVGNGEDKRRVFQAFGREALKQGGLTHLGSWVLDQFYVVIADPVVADLVLKNCLEKDDSMKLFGKFFRESLPVVPVSQWRPRRKFLNPVFAMKHLNQYFEVFRDKGAILIEKLKNRSDCGAFSIYDNMAANSFDVICESTLGVKCSSQENLENPELMALKQMGRLIASRMTQPLLHNQTIYEMTPMYVQLKDVTDNLRAFLDKGITIGYEKFTKIKADVSQDNEVQNTEVKAPSILELLLEANQGDLKNVNDEIMAVVFAGTDTTSVTLSFTCLMLAKYPEVQEKMYQELQEVLGDSKRPLHHEDLPRLKYTEAVLRETLRVYSPGLLLLRKIDKDLVLPSGQTLVKGTSAMIHVWAIHRHPRYWGDDAEQFRPERFFDAPPKHPAAFLPFSYGPRNCVGYQYAIMSMKTTLASLVRRYRLLPASGDDVGNIHKREEMRTTFDILIRDVHQFPFKWVQSTPGGHQLSSARDVEPTPGHQDTKMHCFICVTYMIILTSANPITVREIPTKHEKRSLFRDVIESLRIRSQMAENFKQHDDNNLSHNYDKYGYDNEPLQLPSDADFIPRRNDRIEMPPLKYRYPKNLELNNTDEKSNDTPKEEVVLFIDTHETSPALRPTSTQKPFKKRPQANKNKQNKTRESEDSQSTENYKPLTNNMSGLSQIGDRESQTVIKPTVIVNIRGTVSHRDSEIRLEKRDQNYTLDIPHNVFNINQEVNVDREYGKKPSKIKQDIKIAARDNAKIEEDMMMCETSHKTSDKENDEQNRKFENVLQILFSI